MSSQYVMLKDGPDRLASAHPGCVQGLSGSFVKPWRVFGSPISPAIAGESLGATFTLAVA